MYLLDTNVISELRKGIRAEGNVLAWVNSISSATTFISVITVLELETGILAKERKDKEQGKILRSWFDNYVLPTFSERILFVDNKVALRCAKWQVPNPHSYRDALIGATAEVHGLSIVTRNTKDFKPACVPLLNPWDK